MKAFSKTVSFCKKRIMLKNSKNQCVNKIIMLPNYDEVFHSLQSIIEINMFNNCKSPFDLISVLLPLKKTLLQDIVLFLFLLLHMYHSIISLLYYSSNTRILQHHDSKKSLFQSRKIFLRITFFICLFRRFCIKKKTTHTQMFHS